jgi:hypothetical protein
MDATDTLDRLEAKPKRSDTPSIMTMHRSSKTLNSPARATLERTDPSPS